ncbi:hypothetical protein MMC25_002460 [Agyrium rufum]|nr:hypothetical protein [Agyrium rufum]
MTTTTSSRPSPRTPWTAHSSHSHTSTRSFHRPSTTPLGPPPRTPAVSVGQSLTPSSVPHLSAFGKTPGGQHDKLSAHRAESPNYFGLVVEAGTNPVDSNAGIHAKNNWISSPHNNVEQVLSPKTNVVTASEPEPKPNFEAFRRQSENNTFTLGHGNLAQFGARTKSGRVPTLAFPQIAPPTGDFRRSDIQESPEKRARRSASRSPPPPGTLAKPSMPHSSGHGSQGTPMDPPRTESPANLDPLREPTQRSELSQLDDRHPRNSLPLNRADPPSPSRSRAPPLRADTVPASAASDAPSMIAPAAFVELLEKTPVDEILLLDLRVSPQYTQSRIEGAMNLCIPTTLLKRPAFNIQKLAETFTKPEESEKFRCWKDTKYIVVYDASSALMKDATSCVNTLKKFSRTEWKGTPYILKGGFHAFMKKSPEHVERPHDDKIRPNKSGLTIDSAASMPVAGGCPMPNTKQAANPFFGNIRQNMDLIGGVGQMAVKIPGGVTDRTMKGLPAWIREATEHSDQGKVIASHFLDIEKAEQSRMQQALSANVSYGTPSGNKIDDSVQIAGIEKGVKNRYKDMLPFDHTRVKLQGVPDGDCDYVNASHVKAEWSNRRYIATQAPVPATFEDFWRLVWEQDARVIVMLTAESEGGQRKSHPYWVQGDYGPWKLKSISEKRVTLEQPQTLSPNRYNNLPGENLQASARRRAATLLSSSLNDRDTPKPVSPEAETPYAIVRKMTLRHAGQPFAPLREITQVHYTNWPDFGVPAHSEHVLTLVEHCDALFREANGSNTSASSPARENDRPMVVHCSAGCGRTGTFCTVDSVIDMLKRQRVARKAQQQQGPSQRQHLGHSGISLDDDQDGDKHMMDIDTDSEASGQGVYWETHDDTDLVAKTVADFRVQRISMVQTLRQFVLCYETVLEWLVKEMPDRLKRDHSRLSFQG